MILSISIPDESYAEVVAAFAKQAQYQSKILLNGKTIDNPQTHEEFFRSVLQNQILSVLGQHRLNKKMDTEKEAIKNQLANLNVSVSEQP